MNPSYNKDKVHKYDNDIKLYYDKFFPQVDLMYLLSYHKKYPIKKRELMFKTASSGGKSLNVKRYIFIENTNQHFMNLLRINKPLQIDIGPLYKDSQTTVTANEIDAREYIIDIDLSDYDQIRSCCKQKNMCKKCWKYAAFACSILDKGLKEYWQFDHVMWIFSGRRGIHCWVFDKEAREATIEERMDITLFFSLINGGSKKKLVELTKPFHHLIRSNLDDCYKFFIDVCMKEQKLLDNVENKTYFLEQIPQQFRQDLSNQFKNYKTSLDKWYFFVNYYNNNIKNSSKYECLVEEIIIQYTFPRLDAQVSYQLNHVIKCPFSVHLETRKIALFIKPEEAHLFNPDDAPTIKDLIEQYENWYDFKSSTKFRTFEKSINNFREFINKLKECK